MWTLFYIIFLGYNLLFCYYNYSILGSIGQSFVGRKQNLLDNLEYDGFSDTMFTADEKVCRNKL